MKYLRIKRKKDIEKILKNGKRAHAETLSVVYTKSDTLKMAVCVGKKFGKSVERNAIKRLLREAFRINCENVKPCDFLLIPRVRENYTFYEFSRDLQKIFTKEHLLEG